MKQHARIALMTLGLLMGLLTGLLTACTHARPAVDPTNMNDLQNMSADSTVTPPAEQVSQIRLKALEETAMGLGAQGGLAFASQQINKRTEKDKWYLETIYNFNGMMLSHGVLPPVLEEGNNSLNLADPNTIRIADKTYKIVQQARFATTPPNWREYIWLGFSKPELPNKVLLPRTAEEKELWRKNIKLGWEKGIEQAYSIFQQNLARLKRDYNGMILYRKLLQEKMVSAPYVSKTELGVTGDGNDMRINDQVLRITELPKLQTNSDNWKAIVVKENDN
ncbi:MAG TPA: type IV secretion system DotC family protein [Gammaproteobacteria bacterium]|nr:type IV secretion system DotC family protein [Gammaproteobacteria bacterium]